MRTPLILGLMAVSAIALGACHPKELKHADFAKVSFHDDDDDGDSAKVLKAVTTLDCPSMQGELTRTSQAADGKSCAYTGPADEAVTLTLVDLDGKSVADTFAPMKTDLKTLVPAPPSGPVGVEASKDEGGDRAKIDLPFFHVDAHGDKANVKMFGMDIKADGDNAEIHPHMGMKNTVIHAGKGGAEVLAEDVGKTNASLVYILASDNPGPSGWRAVGYIARGPAAGPLVVGEFKSKASHHGNDGNNDVSKLVDRNVKD
jgi:hypothetical protein